MKFADNLTLALGQRPALQGGMTTLYTPDADSRMIVNLMREDADKLGFIPIPSLLHQIQTKDTLIWQRDQYNRKIGYLIHSDPRPKRPIQVHLCVIQVDRRRRLFATRAVAELVKKAYASDAPYIRLRCAIDLEANHFWLACGFQPIAVLPNLRQNPRDIVLYHLPRANFPAIRHEILIQSAALRGPNHQNNPSA